MENTGLRAGKGFHFRCAKVEELASLPMEYQLQCLYCEAFLHSIVQERRKFGGDLTCGDPTAMKIPCFF